MAYVGHIILIALVITIAFGPRNAQSGFSEHPRNVTEYAGVYVEFHCGHSDVDNIVWHLNGTSIRESLVFPKECRDYSAWADTEEDLDVVYVFIIRADLKCNGTQVHCSALIGLDETREENSTTAMLTVIRPDPVRNLNASFKEDTLSIEVHWDPIPEPKSIAIDVKDPARAFVRTITYQVNITDNFGRLVDSSTTPRVNTAILLANNDINSCYYYDVGVNSMINLNYTGNKASRGPVYPHEDFPSNISASICNATVIDQLEIQYVICLSVSPYYVCSAYLILTYQGMTSRINVSNEIPGMISQLTFVVNESLIDRKYDNAIIFISNALHTVSVTMPPLSTYDVQDVTVENGNLTVVFLNGSTAAGAFIVVMVTDNTTSDFIFEYLPIGKSPLSNNIMAKIILPKTNYKLSSSILSIYDIESSGLLKESLSLMPVNTLQLNASSLITTNNNTDDDSESDWKLEQISRNRTTHSIRFDCKIFNPKVINGCSVIVHSHNSSQGLVLTVNNSINNDELQSLEVKVQNESELYYYAVFPVTSKGIIGSNAKKGRLRLSDNINDGNTVSNNNDLAKILPPLVILMFIMFVSANTPAFLCILYKHRIANGGPGAVHNVDSQEVKESETDASTDASTELQGSSNEKAKQNSTDLEDIEDHDITSM